MIQDAAELLVDAFAGVGLPALGENPANFDECEERALRGCSTCVIVTAHRGATEATVFRQIERSKCLSCTLDPDVELCDAVVDDVKIQRPTHVSTYGARVVLAQAA
jgi:hypothetical protein